MVAESFMRSAGERLLNIDLESFMDELMLMGLYYGVFFSLLKCEGCIEGAKTFLWLVKLGVAELHC